MDDYWLLVGVYWEGLKYDGNPMSIEHLKLLIREGQLQLFMMFGSDDGETMKVFGTCVTRITALPNYNQCEVILLKGERENCGKTHLLIQ